MMVMGDVRVRDGSSTPQVAAPLPIASHLPDKERQSEPKVEDVEPPLIVRCEEEQLIGHQSPNVEL